MSFTPKTEPNEITSKCKFDRISIYLSIYQSIYFNMNKSAREFVLFFVFLFVYFLKSETSAKAKKLNKPKTKFICRRIHFKVITSLSLNQ